MDQLTDIKNIYANISGPPPPGNERASGEEIQKHAQKKFIAMYVPMMIANLEQYLVGGMAKQGDAADFKPAVPTKEEHGGSAPSVPTQAKRGRGRPRKIVAPVIQSLNPISISSVLEEALKR